MARGWMRRVRISTMRCASMRSAMAKVRAASTRTGWRIAARAAGMDGLRGGRRRVAAGRHAGNGETRQRAWPRPSPTAVVPSGNTEDTAMTRTRLAGIALLLSLTGLAVLRSHWGTRLDGFTVDEPWHIV